MTQTLHEMAFLACMIILQPTHLAEKADDGAGVGHGDCVVLVAHFVTGVVDAHDVAIGVDQRSATTSEVAILRMGVLSVG